MLFNSLVEELSLFYFSVIWILPFDISVFFNCYYLNKCTFLDWGHERRIHTPLLSLWPAVSAVWECDIGGTRWHAFIRFRRNSQLDRPWLVRFSPSDRLDPTFPPPQSISQESLDAFMFFWHINQVEKHDINSLKMWPYFCDPSSFRHEGVERWEASWDNSALVFLILPSWVSSWAPRSLTWRLSPTGLLQRWASPGPFSTCFSSAWPPGLVCRRPPLLRMPSSSFSLSR